MVTIVASYNVTPNQPTPNDPLWLSDSDQIGFLGHVPTIYIYKAKHNTNTIEKMRNSLSEILVYYYPVAGRLSLKESGRMEVDCNAKGVTLIEAETTTNTLNDYGDFSPSDSTKELVPRIDYSKPIEELPLLLVQLTRFHGGEGFAIGVAISHPLVDGISAVQFINAWAKLARGETLDPNEIPFLDRTILKNMVENNDSIFRATNLSPAPPVDHPEWKPAPLIPDNNDAKNNNIRVSVLKLTSKQVEKLKKKANIDEPLKEGSRPYSRFEAIAAHTWRCASKARGFGDNQPTVVRFSVDIRNRVIPPLPRTYFGNALAKIVTPKCCVGEIISKPLGFVAQKIRDAIYAVTDEYIRSQLNVILGQEQLDCIRAFFMGQGSHVSSPHPGNHNIHFTSWITMPVYDADFGWGKPMHFGLGSEFREERAVIIPSFDGDGVVLSMSFQTAQMQLFNKFFYEDI